MVWLFKEIFKLLQILNSEANDNQVAFGLSLGFILGLGPWVSLQGVLVLLVILLFRVQAAAAFLSALFFSFIAYFLDPIFHKLGMFFLNIDSLEPLFTKLYNLPLIPFSRFNNSVVMGAGLIGFLLFPFIYFIFKFLVKNYRSLVVSRLKKTKVWKIYTSTSFYKWYVKYEEYFGRA